MEMCGTCTTVEFYTISIWDRCRQIKLLKGGGASRTLQPDWSTHHSLVLAQNLHVALLSKTKWSLFLLTPIVATAVLLSCRVFSFLMALAALGPGLPAHMESLP